MGWLEILVKYWTQLAVLIAALGYAIGLILRVIFEYKFKKREIFFGHYAKAKVDAYIQFTELFYKANDILLRAIGKLDYTIDPANVPDVRSSQTELLNFVYKLHFFLDQKTFDKCQAVVYSHMELCSSYMDIVNNGTANKEELLTLLENFRTVTKRNLDTISEASESFKKNIYSS